MTWHPIHTITAAYVRCAYCHSQNASALGVLAAAGWQQRTYAPDPRSLLASDAARTEYACPGCMT